MKIAMIGHKRIPSREGGIEIVVYELVRRLVKLGHTVDVYNRHTDEPKIKECEGAKIYEIKTFKSSKLNAQVYSAFAAVKAVFKHYDVIHFHAVGPCAMIWLPHFLGIPTVATIHGLDYQATKWGNFAKKYLLFGEKMALKYADEVIVLSKEVQQYYREKFGRETNFVYNGVNEPSYHEPEIIKEKFGLEKNNYFLFLARLTSDKGMDYIVDAYKNLKTDKKLVIAGRDDPSTPYIDYIKEKCKDLGDKVVFTGFADGQMWEELYTNCFCYVFPSDLEGMPLSLLEAISYRVPCIASDLPANMQISKEYVHYFKKGNTSELQEKMQYFLDNEDKRIINFNPEWDEKKKDEVIDSILAKFSWDAVTDKTVELYKRGIKNEKN